MRLREERWCLKENVMVFGICCLAQNVGIWLENGGVRFGTDGVWLGKKMPYSYLIQPSAI